jgi:hypothetical protein
MAGDVDFPRFMAAVGLRSLNEKCFDGWITVDGCGDTNASFCRLALDKAIPFVWAGWLLPAYKGDGQLSHLTWRGPSAAADRLTGQQARREAVSGATAISTSVTVL